MSIYRRGFFLLAIVSLLIACSEQQPTVETEARYEPVGSIQVVAATDSHEHSTTEYTPAYISAVELNERFEENKLPFIFDVRSKGSYEKSHIETAHWVPYGNTDEAHLAKIENLEKDSEIVTYCGCPRHLSSLQAEFLEGLGYTNVKALYDGLWVWQDNGYPTVYTQSAQTTVLKFNGKLLSDSKSLDQTDVFLKHSKSGQLEAARSNANGTFSFDFHLYDYQPDDEFELMVAQLGSEVVKVLAPNRSEIETEIQIEVLL